MIIGGSCWNINISIIVWEYEVFLYYYGGIGVNKYERIFENVRIVFLFYRLYVIYEWFLICGIVLDFF